jgi:hypothetical protein
MQRIYLDRSIALRNHEPSNICNLLYRNHEHSLVRNADSRPGSERGDVPKTVLNDEVLGTMVSMFVLKSSFSVRLLHEIDVGTSAT